MINSTPSFQTIVSGKWILAGEHAVIRGAPAILFPLPAFQLSLTYLDSAQPWQIRLSGNLSDIHSNVIQQVVQHGFALCHQAPVTRGILQIENHIPFSSGLGASAALCTAIGQWFVAAGWLQAPDLIEFARQLENVFHGESSGADIAVTATNHGIYFIRNQELTPFIPNWKPNWYLSHSGEQSATTDCLKKVSVLWHDNPEHAQAIDNLMKSSVMLAKHALGLNPQTGLPLLKEAIEQAASAFLQWGLVTPTLKTQMEDLMKAGALAVKPTGSGNGGFILSLWPHHFVPQAHQALIVLT